MNIVISGASRGIGKAIAERFAKSQNPYTLVLTANNADRLNATATELQKAYPKCTVLTKACDVTDKQQIQEFANWLNTNVKQVDVLVNNAGSFLPGSIHTEADGTLEKMISVNLFSAYYLTRALLPLMMLHKSGHIFNMCSIASLQAYANGGSYSISKFALAGFSKNLREEMKPHNIKVTAVYPGAVYTDSWSGSGVDPQRIMEANDVAEMVFAASFVSPQACIEDIVLRPTKGDL